MCRLRAKSEQHDEDPKTQTTEEEENTKHETMFPTTKTTHRNMNEGLGGWR